MDNEGLKSFKSSLNSKRKGGKMEKRLVIIDGNSLINRAYYAMQRPMITKEGIYTQGIYGFINMLNKIKDDYAPEYLTVAFDLKAPTFRHLEYDQYKAGRKKMPVELAMQMPILKEILHAMNIPTLELEGFEADDIIGTIARLGEEAGMNPLVITGDKDALQLATKTTHILITKKGISDFELYDFDRMIERYHLTPQQFIDLKGLMGDSSDNIPGIPGVGEKTGTMLLEQFGSIENLLSRTEEIEKPALRKKVEENAQLAVMSKRLATINRYVPLEINLEELKTEEPDYDSLIQLYSKLEFKSFIGRLNPDKKELKPIEKQIETLEVKKEIVSSENLLSKLDILNGSNNVYLKVFGNDDHVNEPQISGLFLMDKSNAFYIDCTKLNIISVIDYLNKMNLSICGHDIKNDLYSLMFYGYTDFKVAFDTAVAEYVLNSTRNKYDLKALALEKLKLKIDSFEEFLASSGQVEMFSDQNKKFADYGATLGSAIFEIINIQQDEIQARGLSKVLYEIEIPLIEVLADMEVSGVKVSADFLNEFGIELTEKLHLLEEEIFDYASVHFNINSPIQLGEVLFDNLKLPAGKKTKRGYSTSAETLEKIKDKHPIVDAVIKYRNLSKLISTYVEGIKPLIGPDSRIRSHFRQTVTATGRISSTEPNLQNIPIRQELGRNLRKAFYAEEGCTLVGADYSQIELRVLAHLSQDKSLVEAFNKGKDIHRMTASRVLGVPADKVTITDRSRAKAVNFGVIYGMSGFGLSEELHISRKDAEEYIEEYFKKHTKVKEYMDDQIKKCKTLGYSETMTGRKRAIPEINASSYMVRQLGERLAMNSPIQGSAADIIKIAMVKTYNALKTSHPTAKLILQVHDELIIECKDNELNQIKELLKKNMENAVQLSVKLAADLNTGKTWYDLK